MGNQTANPLANGTTISWQGTTLGSVVSASMRHAVNAVDCSTLDSDQIDNRCGLMDYSGEVTISLKDGAASLPEVGEYGILTIVPPGVPGGISGTVACTEASYDASVDAHNMFSFSFVSSEATLESPSSGAGGE